MKLSIMILAFAMLPAAIPLAAFAAADSPSLTPGTVAGELERGIMLCDFEAGASGWAISGVKSIAAGDEEPRSGEFYLQTDKSAQAQCVEIRRSLAIHESFDSMGIYVWVGPGETMPEVDAIVRDRRGALNTRRMARNDAPGEEADEFDDMLGGWRRFSLFTSNLFAVASGQPPPAAQSFFLEAVRIKPGNKDGEVAVDAFSAVLSDRTSIFPLYMAAEMGECNGRPCVNARVFDLAAPGTRPAPSALRVRAEARRLSEAGMEVEASGVSDLTAFSMPERGIVPSAFARVEFDRDLPPGECQVVVMLEQASDKESAAYNAMRTAILDRIEPGQARAAVEPLRGAGGAGIKLCGEAAQAACFPVCGLRLVSRENGPQVMVDEYSSVAVACVRAGENAEVGSSIGGMAEFLVFGVTAALLAGEQAEIEVSLDCPGATGTHKRELIVRRGEPVRVVVPVPAQGRFFNARLLAGVNSGEEATVAWSDAEWSDGVRSFPAGFSAPAHNINNLPPPPMPPLRPGTQQAMIEFDWRMQDGIGTPLNPSSYSEALGLMFDRGDALAADLAAAGVDLEGKAGAWRDLRAEFDAMPADAGCVKWADLWRRTHELRRRLVLSNPLAGTGPVVFVKKAPSVFSHQLTEYYGAAARPGGGVCVLDEPGVSMHCRELTDGMFPQGSFEFVDVSFDGQRLMFAYCEVPTTPKHRAEHLDRFFHLYEMNADGSNLRRITDGPQDDFAPRYLPDGRIIFLSTRRGGFHRCGAGPCNVYTLTLANADGSDARTVSFHETQEWDPAVLNDGRVIYSRWDYVDRHAVHYQQLWSARPDGTNPRIYYGNYTLNPVGVWEPRAVPGSTKVMATAAAHHAMTAGSIVLLDTRRGRDNMAPIARLTPDALFPESEAPVGGWSAPYAVQEKIQTPAEALRWPGHCYRTAYPLSEKYFLASYSFEKLLGESAANKANMFGLYIVDAFGNKELLYRDMNISSIWPSPLRARRPKPAVQPVASPAANGDGVFFLQDVRNAYFPLPDEPVKRLRIVQVLPKTTPHANNPTVGLPFASPGKQVLGTVPVEADGSAYFKAPAGIPLQFQALDSRGQAMQIMRSITYLQPGETISCLGCHEHRSSAPPPGRMAEALKRPPSAITPGPDGSKPLSYPILVQPVLDRHCTRCHSRESGEGPGFLTGEPDGRYTASYNMLAKRVVFPCWGGTPIQIDGNPTRPDAFGARAGKLMAMLLGGHPSEDVPDQPPVELEADDVERLATWMDANALFYGTFDYDDQARQQRGERIAGPKLE